MREIKFKAICQHDETGRFHSQDYGVSQSPVLPSDRYHWVVKDLQYIGLKDKNGIGNNDVCEGNIIKTKHGKIYKVVWCNGRCAFIGVSFDNVETNDWIPLGFHYYEVIGDIYQGQYHNDNPELLEGRWPHASTIKRIPNNNRQGRRTFY